MTVNGEIALAIIAAFAMLALLSLMGAYIVIGMAWDRSPLRSSAARKGIAGEEVSGWILTGRALRLRCPACGTGRIFGAGFKTNESCPQCGTSFWRDEGEWLGPAVLDYSMATAGGLVVWAVMILMNASEAAQMVGALAAAAVGAAVTSRWSRSLWTLLLYISGEAEAGSADERGTV